MYAARPSGTTQVASRVRSADPLHGRPVEVIVVVVREQDDVERREGIDGRARDPSRAGGPSTAPGTLAD